MIGVVQVYYMQLSLADSGLDFHVTGSCDKDCVRNSVLNKDKRLQNVMTERLIFFCLWGQNLTLRKCIEKLC